MKFIIFVFFPIGCLRNGAEDIKRHKWFSRIDWTAVFQLQLEPPFIPEVINPFKYSIKKILFMNSKSSFPPSSSCI